MKHNTAESRTPDYGFENGLQWRELDLVAGESYDRSVSRDVLRSLPNVNDDPTRDERVAEQMLRPYTVRGLGGRAIRFAVVGPEDASQINYAGYGWGGQTAHPVAIGEAQALAASRPDEQWLFIDTLGAGGSEALSDEQREQIVRLGHYGLLGEHLAKATEGVMDGKAVDLYGHSLGGRTALGMAPHIEGGVNRLIVNDPTGSQQLNLAQIAYRYIAREGRHLGNYVKAGFDQAASERQRAPVSAAIKDTWIKQKGSLEQMFWTDPNGLRHASLEHDMALAVPAVKQELRIISPEMSALNDHQAVADIMARVVESTRPNAAVRQWVLKNHTHSFMAAAPAVEAYFYGQ